MVQRQGQEFKEEKNKDTMNKVHSGDRRNVQRQGIGSNDQCVCVCEWPAGAKNTIDSLI